MIAERRELIASYSSQRALEDGVLREPYPERWPRLLISLDVHQACCAQACRTYDQALVPLLTDCIAAVHAPSHAAKSRPRSRSSTPSLVRYGSRPTSWAA